MLKANSEVFRNNHHSLNRKQSPYSLHSSKNDSMQKARKMSTASLKENMPDLEKLIMDIKISPLPDNNNQSIKQIFTLLKQLQSNSLVSDQVHAVYLLMQSIQNKLNNSNKQKFRPSSKAAFRKDSIYSDQKQLSQVSPIKQIEQTSSRILYTNFSLKQIERNINEENSLIQSSKKSAIQKIVVSKFEGCENTDQVDKLNQQIRYLQKLLEKKTKGSNLPETTLFKKKHCRF